MKTLTLNNFAQPYTRNERHKLRVADLRQAIMCKTPLYSKQASTAAYLMMCFRHAVQDKKLLSGTRLFFGSVRPSPRSAVS